MNESERRCYIIINNIIILVLAITVVTNILWEILIRVVYILLSLQLPLISLNSFLYQRI